MLRRRPACIVIVGLVLVLAACSPKRVLRSPVPPAGSTPAASVVEPAPPTADTERDLGDIVAGLALDQIGRPYRWGGDDPVRGFDCSGLVQWACGEVGIALPRVVRDQRRAGRSVAQEALAPGDLVFFAMGGSRISHVGVYVGGGDFVHAPSSGRPVRTDSLEDPFWSRRWRDARRVAAE
jgi:cell wall-associated NlpC family hydrolase